MKNYINEGQKLPLYGIGPYLIYGMAAISIVGIILFSYVFKTGILTSAWILIFRLAGAFLLFQAV